MSFQPPLKHVASGDRGACKTGFLRSNYRVANMGEWLWPEVIWYQILLGRRVSISHKS